MTLIWAQCTDWNGNERDSLLHLVSYLFRITVVSCCVWVKLYCTQSLRISSDHSCSPSLIFCSTPASFLLFFFNIAGSPPRFWAFALRSNRAAEGKKEKISLIEYWSGIVRQAEMTKFTHENKAASHCAVFCCNQLFRARRCIHQSGITWSFITAVSCDHVVTNLVKTHAGR